MGTSPIYKWVLKMYIDESFYNKPQWVVKNAPEIEGRAVRENGYFGATFTFKKAGDVLSAHKHTYGTNHLTFVMQGSLIQRIYNEDGTTTDTNYVAPALSVVAPDVTHEFIALEDNSVCINIFCNSIVPTGY